VPLLVPLVQHARDDVVAIGHRSAFESPRSTHATLGYGARPGTMGGTLLRAVAKPWAGCSIHPGGTIFCYSALDGFLTDQVHV
jgi:hypothetical protein